MTQAEYAEHSGLTRSRVSQLVAKGMPLDSPEAADAWRGHSNKTGRPRKNPPPKPPQPEPNRLDSQQGVAIDIGLAEEDSPQGAYERQKKIERAAYALATQALQAKALDAARMVGVHATAAKNLVTARQDVLDLSEREKRLVSGDWVKKTMTDHDGAVAQLLKAMPKQLSGRIAPHDPEHAERELERWVQEVALKTLHSTDPWN